jgi:hypothetical protein
MPRPNAQNGHTPRGTWRKWIIKVGPAADRQNLGIWVPLHWPRSDSITRLRANYKQCGAAQVHPIHIRLSTHWHSSGLDDQNSNPWDNEVRDSHNCAKIEWFRSGHLIKSTSVSLPCLTSTTSVSVFIRNGSSGSSCKSNPNVNNVASFKHVYQASSDPMTRQLDN